jgi:hypothetical protein
MEVHAAGPPPIEQYRDYLVLLADGPLSEGAT